LTITADFSGGEKTVTTNPLYQWDTGQKLALSGLPATSTDIQVHFANAAMAQAIVKATELVGSLPTCDIPNEFLQFGSASRARAWVYFKEGSSKGYTVRTVLIPVTPRKRPNDYVSPEDPDSQGIVDRALELLEHYQSDLDAKEEKSNKKTTLTGNESSNDFYPTTKAVADAMSTKAPASTAYTFDTTTTTVTFNENNPKIIYLNATVGSPDNEKGIVLTSADNTVQYFFGAFKTVRVRNRNGASTYTPWEIALEKDGNKKNIINSTNLSSTEFYPSIKAVVDYLTANYIGNGNNTVSWDNLAVAVQTLINGKESASNKLTSEAGIDGNSTDTEYPSAKAVFDLGVQITDDINEDIMETNSNLSDLKAYIGYTDGDILGLHADFENMQFTRLGAAVGLTAGQDFNAFPMYGQRRRVVVDSDGVIDETESPENITENDTNVDVMVYQPKFYYKVVPLKLEKQSGGLGYHIRKANYYISSTPHAGFKLHPLFFDKNGNEIDYVLFSAYEASYMWRRQVGTDRYVDTIFHDGVDTDTTIATTSVLKSLPGVKPISGQYKAMNKVNMENCALRKSSNWHLDTIQSVSANQLLMAIEYGSFNTQSAIGLGIVSNTNVDTNNCSSLTGSTSAETFNTASGMASETIYDVAGTETPFNTNGKVAVSYRGMENPWGNIWKHVNGINIWGDGTMNGGQVYIADNFNFNEEVKGETTINNVHYKYSSAGFSLANSSSNAYNYISAFGYGKEEYDWLFMPSETTGNSSLPVGDNFWCTSNLSVSDSDNGYRITRFGCYWDFGDSAGGFCWSCNYVPGFRNHALGGRLLYVPTATV